MAKGIRYTEEFKQEAANQVILHNYPVAEVSERLGVSPKTLYNWVRHYSQPPKKRVEQEDLQAEIARLKKQLKRAEQERDILKEAARFFANESKNDTHS
jgi:transposase